MSDQEDPTGEGVGEGVVEEDDVQGRLDEAFNEGLAEGYADGINAAKDALGTVLSRMLSKIIAEGNMAQSAEQVRLREAEAALVEMLIDAIDEDDVVETTLADDDGYRLNLWDAEGC